LPYVSERHTHSAGPKLEDLAGEELPHEDGEAAAREEPEAAARSGADLAQSGGFSSTSMPPQPTTRALIEYGLPENLQREGRI
jgi:hypothetical protein